jgi:hypothetical protein
LLGVKYGGIGFLAVSSVMGTCNCALLLKLAPFAVAWKKTEVSSILHAAKIVEVASDLNSFNEPAVINGTPDMRDRAGGHFARSAI